MNRIYAGPEEIIWLAKVGPGIRFLYPCRCWAETHDGRRCQKDGTHTWQPVGERVPYALCSVHSQLAARQPERLCLLAPNWNRHARNRDRALKRMRMGPIHRAPIWQRY